MTLALYWSRLLWWFERKRWHRKHKPTPNGCGFRLGRKAACGVVTDVDFDGYTQELCPECQVLDEQSGPPKPWPYFYPVRLKGWLFVNRRDQTYNRHQDPTQVLTWRIRLGKDFQADLEMFWDAPISLTIEWKGKERFETRVLDKKTWKFRVLRWAFDFLEDRYQYGQSQIPEDPYGSLSDYE